MRLILLATLCLSSTGDQLSEFVFCLRRCQSGCPEDFRPTIAETLTFWSCSDNCKYECMHDISNIHKSTGEEIHQYYGKWPFYRFLGMQEPASVCFSIGNGYMHFKGAQKYFARIGPRYLLRPAVLVCAFAAINTWVWSAVFHTRDIPITEKVFY